MIEQQSVGITTEAVSFRYRECALEIFLVPWEQEPFVGSWALPGGPVGVRDSLEESVRRELRAQAGIDAVYIEQLYSFGEVDRDPRARVISVAYLALAGPTSADARPPAFGDWFALERLPSLAFDHAGIIAAARDRLKSRIREAPLGFYLVPEKFSLRELQGLYECILETALEKRNFRRKVSSLGLLAELAETQQNVPHRAAQLYRVDPQKQERLLRRGFSFRI